MHTTAQSALGNGQNVVFKGIYTGFAVIVLLIYLFENHRFVWQSISAIFQQNSIYDGFSVYFCHFRLKLATNSWFLIKIFDLFSGRHDGSFPNSCCELPSVGVSSPRTQDSLLWLKKNILLVEIRHFWLFFDKIHSKIMFFIPKWQNWIKCSSKNILIS